MKTFTSFITEVSRKEQVENRLGNLTVKKHQLLKNISDMKKKLIASGDLPKSGGITPDESNPVHQNPGVKQIKQWRKQLEALDKQSDSLVTEATIVKKEVGKTLKLKVGKSSTLEFTVSSDKSILLTVSDSEAAETASISIPKQNADDVLEQLVAFYMEKAGKKLS